MTQTLAWASTHCLTAVFAEPIAASSHGYGGRGVLAATNLVFARLDNWSAEDHAGMAIKQGTCFRSWMTEPSQKQVEELSFAFERFTRRFKVAEAAAAAGNALNGLDAATLVFISDNANVGAGDVARYLDVVPTTMSSAIDRLVRKGLVERRRPEENRRAIALTATEKGLQIVLNHKQVYRNACVAMLRALDTAEQAALIRLTQKIANTKVA
jgi:DNA-binding MarR family transcriptional regulator